MAVTYSAHPKDNVFVITAGEKELLTPGKAPFLLPNAPMAEAVCQEWITHQGKYSPHNMPLTALAYTAIDQIGHQKERIIEALMVYIDTDALSYRATGSELLAKSQTMLWDPLLAWASKRLGAVWEVTTGVMPLDQSPELHAALGKWLGSLDAMHLSAACMLASGLSSLALALAVLERHIDAEEGFRLSRLEEESQAEAWGRDAEAESRAARLKAEILSAARFLDLLDGR